MNSDQQNSPLALIAGTWHGTGSGFFPTIDDFEYREELIVDWSPGSDSMVHYTQRTWRLTDEGERPSHQETGFIVLEGEYGVKVLNAQGEDRVEVLRGTVDLAGGGLGLRLESAVLAHDYRMVAAGREITIEGDTLSYSMWMTTDRVAAREGHLKATLRRQ